MKKNSANSVDAISNCSVWLTSPGSARVLLT